jgi:hypothetical protein
MNYYSSQSILTAEAFLHSASRSTTDSPSLWVWVLCSDRRSVGQYVLEWSTHLGLTTRSWLLLDSCGSFSLTRGRVCRLQLLLVLASAVILVTKFYTLRFQTSLLVASYDSQGYGGGIRPRLHREFYSKVEVTLRLTVSQSVSKSWCRAPCEAHDQIVITVWQLRSCFCVGCPLWREDGSVFYICCWHLPAQSFSSPSPVGLATIFYCLRFETSIFVAPYYSRGMDFTPANSLPFIECWRTC